MSSSVSMMSRGPHLGIKRIDVHVPHGAVHELQVDEIGEILWAHLVVEGIHGAHVAAKETHQVEDVHALADEKSALGGVDAPNLRILPLPELDLEHVQTPKFGTRDDLLGNPINIGEPLHESHLSPCAVGLGQFGQFLGFRRGVGRRLFGVYRQTATKHHRRKLVLLRRRSDGKHTIKFLRIKHLYHVGVNASRAEVAGVALRFLFVEVTHGDKIYLGDELNLRKYRGSSKGATTDEGKSGSTLSTHGGKLLLALWRSAASLRCGCLWLPVHAEKCITAIIFPRCRGINATCFSQPTISIVG